jgi:PAS domain S-box-containing protein
MAFDVTKRKRAEEALLESEGKYRDLIETINDMVWEMDTEGRCIYASPGTKDLLGYDPGEVLGKTPYHFMPPEDAGKVAEILDSLQARHEPFKLLEYPVVRKDGTRAIVETNGVPMFDRDGRYKGFRGVNRDITDRKHAEEEIKAAKQQAELYVDLMGHDINNMNQVSLGFLELAHNMIEMDGKLGEDNIVLLEKAMGALKDSSQLIDSVRKIQREKMGLYEPQVLDVGAVITEAIIHFDRIPGRDVKIAYDQDKHYFVKANSLLKDVFINLIGNAIKHSRGPLAINIHASPVTDNGKKYCRVAVEDNGPGIPDTLKSTIFDRLNLTATRAKGKGFGLCLIKMLVDDYCGRFSVEDRVKGDYAKGARFVVILPVAE